MLIQFHFLQNYAPSNLNRDDTGSPKDAIFGGAVRGRISSQCLKRSIRKSEAFREEFEADELLGTRTRTLPAVLRAELEALGADAQAIQAIVKRVPEIGRESTKRDKNEAPEDEDEGEGGSPEAPEATEDSTKQLIFIDRKTEARALAQQLFDQYRKVGAAKWDKTKIADITRQLGERLPRSVDIALFGRMTTSAAFRNVQAAAQVAHALSTNALKQEFDYYTAMDDEKPEQEPGADMIGDIEYNSCTYYRYLNVHWEELVRNLGGDLEVARRAVLALLEAAATAQPTGKQNSFAAFNLPDFVLVEVSQRNLPVSYANAFLRPVSAFGKDELLSKSAEQLADYITRLSRAYNLTAARAVLSVSDTELEGATTAPSLADLKQWLGAQLPRG